ncbi:hypothetical protein BZA05DRAFT_475213 [Tricharina praecox]|uniref:uncharacterized protein n=1 Tax=Tricharina praecox TaxID=43433 RepID=UPI0022210BFD|nr:uncharacterized protein BZA05DRAFT_475213 [Tricharina praecox]KAI5848896.1 hypothetical protein BZA05DRAFT_475213 [Tricharina praecox]
MTPPTAARTRPIEPFAKAVAACSVEASAYGKCIFRDYNNVSKDMCLQDFMRLRECVTGKLKKR